MSFAESDSPSAAIHGDASSVQASHQTTNQPSILPEQKIALGAIFYSGIVLPILSPIFANLGPAGNPTWQDGTYSAKLAFILHTAVGWPMLLFLAGSVISLLTVFCVRASHSKGWVRFGIASGIPVAAIYAVLVPLSSGVSPLQYLLLSTVFGLVVYTAMLAIRKVSSIISAPVAGVVFCVVSFLSVIACAVFGEDAILVFLGLPVGAVALSAFCGPVWCFAAYGYCTYRLSIIMPSHRRFTMVAVLAWVSWIAGMMAAVRQSVLNSFARYSELPLEQPGCYIATAAAHGHRVVVRPKSIVTAGGTLISVTSQLQNFKAAELTLACLWPGLHRGLRWVYDRVGSRLAKQIRSPWIADLVYLSLKPAEWIAVVGLLFLLGNRRSEIRKIYAAR